MFKILKKVCVCTKDHETITYILSKGFLHNMECNNLGDCFSFCVLQITFTKYYQVFLTAKFGFPGGNNIYTHKVLLAYECQLVNFVRLLISSMSFLRYLLERILLYLWAQVDKSYYIIRHLNFI